MRLGAGICGCHGATCPLPNGLARSRDQESPGGSTVWDAGDKEAEVGQEFLLGEPDVLPSVCFYRGMEQGKEEERGKGGASSGSPSPSSLENHVQVDSAGGEEGGRSQSCHRGHPTP